MIFEAIGISLAGIGIAMFIVSIVSFVVSPKESDANDTSYVQINKGLAILTLLAFMASATFKFLSI